MQTSAWVSWRNGGQGVSDWLFRAWSSQKGRMGSLRSKDCRVAFRTQSAARGDHDHFHAPTGVDQVGQGTSACGGMAFGEKFVPDPVEPFIVLAVSQQDAHRKHPRTVAADTEQQLLDGAQNLVGLCLDIATEVRGNLAPDVEDVVM
eukprot:Opistho-1_new@97900